MQNNLAIVIPYYKLTFFEETLLSLANQTNKQFKIYIGNDASPENPSLLLEKYKGKFDFVYHKFETNLGGISLVQQWNRCIAKVEDEEWLLILGDDDVLSDNVVEEFYKNINEINSLESNVIRYATVVIDENGTEISNNYTHPKLETSTDFLMRKIKGGTRSSLSEFIFKKTAFDKVGFKDLPLAWYSDYLAVLEVSNFSTLFTINNSLVYFRHSGINITSKKDNLTLKSSATFKYYYYLLDEKKTFFNAQQVEILKHKLEKTFLDNKKNIVFWKKFSTLYIRNGYFKQYILFLRKAILMTIKKKTQ